MIERSAASPGMVRSAHKCHNTKIQVLRAICQKIGEFCGRLVPYSSVDNAYRFSITLVLSATVVG
jgi:hypothetical protein